MRNLYRLILSALLVLTSGLASAQIKVSALPNGTTPVTGDYAICDQSGVTNKCTYSQVAQSVNNTLGLGTWATQSYPTFISGDCLSNNGSLWLWAACGGVPAGSNGQIQYNNGGIFGGYSTIPITNGGTGANSLAGAGIPVFSGGIVAGHCTQWLNSTTIADAGSVCGSGGGGAPGGSSGQVQYNNSGVFGGLTYQSLQGFLNALTPNVQSGTSYAFGLTDRNLPFPGTIFTAGSTVTATIPNDSTIAWQAGDELAPQQGGTGAMNLTAGSGTILCSTWSYELTAAACSGSGGLNVYPTYNIYEGQVWRHTTVANTWQLTYQTPYGTQQQFNLGAGQVAMPTGSIAAQSGATPTCSAVTVASYYAKATSKAVLTPAVDSTTVAGYVPASPGAGNLDVTWYFSNSTQPGQLNIKLCNRSASAITAGALTMNYTIFP